MNRINLLIFCLQTDELIYGLHIVSRILSSLPCYLDFSLYRTIPMSMCLTLMRYGYWTFQICGKALKNRLIQHLDTYPHLTLTPKSNQHTFFSILVPHADLLFTIYHQLLRATDFSALSRMLVMLLQAH